MSIEWLVPHIRFLETEVLALPSPFLFAAKGKEGRKALQQPAEEEKTGCHGISVRGSESESAL